MVIYGQFELAAKDLFLRPCSRIGVRRGDITRATGGLLQAHVSSEASRAVAIVYASERV